MFAGYQFRLIGFSPRFFALPTLNQSYLSFISGFQLNFVGVKADISGTTAALFRKHNFNRLAVRVVEFKLTNGNARWFGLYSDRWHLIVGPLDLV